MLLLQAFGYAGFLIAMVWIYVIANEIVNLLQVNVFKFSKGIFQ